MKKLEILLSVKFLVSFYFIPSQNISLLRVMFFFLWGRGGGGEFNTHKSIAPQVVALAYKRKDKIKMANGLGRK